MIDWSNCNETRAGVWDLDLGESIMSGDDLRYTIHHDTNYPHQSYAKVEVWDAHSLDWHLTASLLWPQWAREVHQSGVAGTGGIWIAADELRARAVALLDPDGVEAEREPSPRTTMNLVDVAQWCLQQLEEQADCGNVCVVDVDASQLACEMFSAFRDDNGYDLEFIRVDARWSTLDTRRT